MIKIRDDDVLVGTSSQQNPIKKFKMVHEWICEVPETLLHVPTILVTEIQEFPEIIPFIREEAAEGRMEVQIHGLHHVDYAKLEEDEIVNHLEYCKGWLRKNMGVEPTRFYTPWGAGANGTGEVIHVASARVELEVVTTEKTRNLSGGCGVVQALYQGQDIHDFMQDREVLLHWWENATRLKRVVEVLKHGGWQEAKARPENRHLFKGA